MSDEITQLSIKKLLSGKANYIIPIYQRNYAWDECEITQLIQDIIDYLPGKCNYYIGTLVVFERMDGNHSVYETIDGQQRLTTLSLLASYLKNETDCSVSWYEKLAIDFDSREHSRQTFRKIFEGQFKDDPSELLVSKDINTAILNGYRLIKKALPQKLDEKDITPKEFAEFLFENVQIMRVKVPRDTDLNHYFEIMNNRGEQLEMHEVLKSRMMEILKDDSESQNCLHVVWEACANMEKYVQMGFPPAQRDAIFGAKDWGRFDVKDFGALQKIINQSPDKLSDKETEQTLDEIIGGIRANTKQSKEDETPERFNTVINFSNFLLHVLRIQKELDIPLDDKKLISIFENHLLKSDNVVEKVKKFTFDLLRCKFLYDQYIIKREFIRGTEGWSLKRFKWNNGGAHSRTGHGYYVNTFRDEDTNDADNRRVLMLLSAFHVSTPTLVYKHWLNAALHYLFTADIILADAYLSHMESIAQSFLFDRFLSPNNKQSYYKIIYENKGICKTLRENIAKDCIEEKLSFGKIENNLIFNYLDYLLWGKYKATDNTIKDYEFSFRSSVEHYYPQHPLPGQNPLSPKTLNSFGNLCLISHSKNSRLSNFTPEMKREHYHKNTIDSIKQYLMMNDKRWTHWNKLAIETHFEEMKEVLLNAIGSN